MSTAIKTRKGCLMLIQERHSWTSAQMYRQERATYRFVIVTKANRAGLAILGEAKGGVFVSLALPNVTRYAIGEDKVSRDKAPAFLARLAESYDTFAEANTRSEEHTSELQSHVNLVCR